MELQVVGAKEPLSVSDIVFDREFSGSLVHQVVVAYRNAGRSGTKAQKTRSEVRGTTKKFKKQKGGGARHGDYRAPIFVGGGVTFAAKPRSFAQKVNKKMFRGAVQAILSELNRQGRLKVVTGFDITKAKTQHLLEKLKDLDLGKKVLLVTEDVNQNIYLAARNLPYIAVCDVSALDPVSLVDADHVVVTVESIKRIEEWLA
jgi:large subunit ribosomal protein L4